MSSNLLKLYRVDYAQVGLCSANGLRVLEIPSNSQIVVAVGDQASSVHAFLLRNADLSKATQMFRTLPAYTEDNGVNFIQLILSNNGAPKILAGFANGSVRCFNRKGKEFFALELSNLAEKIAHLYVRWPNEIFIAGQHTFAQYVLSDTDSSNNSSFGQGSSVLAGARFVCPAPITAMIVLNSRFKQKTVTLLACEDRLLRILFDSTCEYEIETCGIASCLIEIGEITFVANTSCIAYFAYGTLDGRISLVQVDFGSLPLNASHCWEIHLPRSKSSVLCMAIDSSMHFQMKSSDENSENQSANTVDGSNSELVVGRADGAVELFNFAFAISAEGEEYIDLKTEPKLRAEFRTGESVIGIQICLKGQLVVCCTFTGMVFGLLRTESSEADLQARLETLELECEQLEIKVNKEKIRYQETITSSTVQGKSLLGEKRRFALSKLALFRLNESFVLQDDASYLLTLECEAAIDCVFVQSDIPLDLMDCERNSAVVSFKDPTYEQNMDIASSNALLATFRCQVDTRQLQIRVFTIEGHLGIIRVYVLSRLSPKVCLVRHFVVKALSLHRRKYFSGKRKSTGEIENHDLDTENDHTKDENTNQLVLIGAFSLAEAHSWLYHALPEIPERLTSSSGAEYSFECTLTESTLKVILTRGRLAISSTSVSSISILKEYCTREATRKSIAIELRLKLTESSVSACLFGVWRRLKPLVLRKHAQHMREAISELAITDQEIAQSMEQELKLENEKVIEEESEEEKKSNLNELERLYGLIADLYIDYQKLKGEESQSFIQGFKGRVGEMINIIKESVLQEGTFEHFVCQINKFWGFTA